jgi:hypothetical protein
MAVGLSINNQANFIVDQWNGTSWQDATYNNPSGVATVSPQAITCISSTDCWIVGTQSATQGAAATLIALNWNGTSWLTSSSLTTPAAPPAGPQDGPAPPALSAISCNGANNCMAVGSYSDKSSGAQDTLADLYSAQ